MATLMSEVGKILGDFRRRREWLWLRAHEKEDETSIEILERVDPRLPARMSATVRHVQDLQDPRERKAAYGRLLDERMPWFDDGPCRCGVCARPAPCR